MGPRDKREDDQRHRKAVYLPLPQRYQEILVVGDIGDDPVEQQPSGSVTGNNQGAEVRFSTRINGSETIFYTTNN